MSRTNTRPLTDETGSTAQIDASKIGWREAYHALLNVDEYPEILAYARAIARDRLLATSDDLDAPWPPARTTDVSSQLADMLDRLGAVADGFSSPWQYETEDLMRRRCLHYFTQFLPVAVVDGCWLQGGLRVATAHTRVGGAITRLYRHQVRATDADANRHFSEDYRSLYGRMGAPLEEASSRTFSMRPDIINEAFILPTFLLAVAQFTRTFAGEILGVNLAWQFLGLSALGPDLIRDTSEAYAYPVTCDSRSDDCYLREGRDLACEAAASYLEWGEACELGERWDGLTRGVHAGVVMCKEWLRETEESAPSGQPDPNQEMADLLWRKAPHACGYHGDCRLGARKIDDLLRPKTFNARAVVEALSGSPWVRVGKTGKSPFLNRLIGFGGPMFGVFSTVEQEIVRRWIDSLSAERGSPSQPHSGDASTSDHARQVSPAPGEVLDPEHRLRWRAQLRVRSRQSYDSCTVRELYHYLVNIEYHPDVLPVGERFAEDRLERSRAMLWKGARPIPSRSYCPSALKAWVHKTHRAQVDSYRRLESRPPVCRKQFIETTVQLAPTILIDGAWLQAVASPTLVQSTVGRMLFRVLIEELGEGRVEEHHANIYRDLLASMGEEAPPVESLQFARWSRLQDESFDVPTFWLAIACFPRHFLPEILGLNLAVEIAGLGGPYMEARDTLRQFGYPTLFVDVHNAADNVSAGHVALALGAIERYMDQRAEREGPHNIDPIWHRVWTGVRATLPQIGRTRMALHSLQRRLVSHGDRSIPLIFPP